MRPREHTLSMATVNKKVWIEKIAEHSSATNDILVKLYCNVVVFIVGWLEITCKNTRTEIIAVSAMHTPWNIPIN